MEQPNVQYSQSSRFALQSSSNFKIFMSGCLLTRIGDWMDLVALNWAVLQFTNSPLYLGFINACRLIPTFLLSIPAGVLADRYDRRRLLLFIYTGIMMLTFLIGYIVETKQPLWLFAIVVTLRAMLAAMDPPIRNAMIPNLVPKSSLTSAIAIHTAIIHLSRIVGPALAGVLLAVTGIANLFYINAWGMLGGLLTLLMVRTECVPYTKCIKKKKATFRDALDYVKNQPSVQSLLILAIVPMVFGFPYTTMLPLFASDLLSLGPKGIGVLLSISSIGALLGTFWLSLNKEIKGTGKWLVYSIIGFGCSLLLFIGSKNVIVAGFAMFLVGLTSQAYRTMSRITLQMQVPDQLRGRILSIALMDRGFIPIGSIIIGAVATWSGTLWAGTLMGTGCIVTTLLIITTRRQILKL